MDCRKEWLSLESEYKGFVTVARDSLDKVDASDINQIQNKSYHVSCYQLFTNVSKLKRAEQQDERAAKEEEVPPSDQQQQCCQLSSTLSGDRRKSAR